MSNQKHCIHHPGEFPIELNPRNTLPSEAEHLPELKLVCQSKTPFSSGSFISIQLPEVCDDIEVPGIVDWCNNTDNGYELGIKFSDQDSMMRIRMLEQVCFIKRYRASVLSLEGRDISDQDAALEWIAKYSRLFPAAR